ncbi:hypothetical protein GDO81_008017 [Engystomops pustulosus]|uniref:Uncharacterized protein n=1 Tax=Engystomops pustulosus TaxID=76066 RepID=A0AAV7CC90_ENGPU|nr:hypothetical protein GDO81_008017 [Engystomops pustulosus]
MIEAPTLRTLYRESGGQEEQQETAGGGAQDCAESQDRKSHWIAAHVQEPLSEGGVSEMLPVTPLCQRAVKNRAQI